MNELREGGLKNTIFVVTYFGMTDCQQIINWSKLIMETQEKRREICSKIIIKAPERRH